ncbi:MAG TPA: NEW3 domain-containing protein [Bauldia sp.]|nr:NEW3 domain-containing protein [Bauldia sp.]
MLRARTLLFSAALAALALVSAAHAQSTDTTTATPVAPPPPAQSSNLQGLWLTTAYPQILVRMGDTINLDLNLQNRGLPPARVEFNIDNLPKGWSWELDGNGRRIGAAMVGPDTNEALQLKLTPAADAQANQTYDFQIVGKTDTQTLNLPIQLFVGAAKPAVVTVTPKLPALRGTPTSAFDFDVDIKNDGPDDQTFNLIADGPDGFQTTFQEQFGQQQLTSVPIKAGETKTLKASVKLPQNITGGQYQVAVQAASPQAHGETPLLLDVTGQPAFDLNAPEGRLSGNATAGKESTFKLTLHNSGTAPATDVKFNATAPTGWKVEFDPKQVPSIDAGQDVDLSINMTPPDNAIAGDYIVALSASGAGAYQSTSYRVTVLTSTLWGVAGLGIIGAAVIVLAAAVTRYGRR